MNYKVLMIIAIVLLTSVPCSGISFEEKSVADSGLSVITIGTGTPKYSESKANSSTAIKYNDTYYIVDCGDGSNMNMMAADIDYKDIGAILFTHHHIDHTTDFFDIYAKCMLSGSDELAVVGPPRTSSFVDFANDVYLDDILYRMSNTYKNPLRIDRSKLTDYAKVTELKGNDEIIIDDLRITTAEMTHTMYDLAYRFEVDGKSIVVSGDTSYDEDLISLSKDADILVIDGTLYKPNTEKKANERTYLEPFYEYGGNFKVDPHLTFEDMITIAEKANVKTLVITHYNNNSDSVDRIETSISKIKSRFDGEVIYATDMMEIKVDGSTGSFGPDQVAEVQYSYPIVDTNQTEFYSNTSVIDEPSLGDKFYGQDASYSRNQPSYTDNNDGTISDNVTGLSWAKDMDEKMTYDEAMTYANESNLGGYDDWRIPTIKELYSLIQFNGRVQGEHATDNLFIDTEYFNQPLGDISKGEREIDAQTWSSTKYVGETMRSDATIFGVNFVDGRIKGYPEYNKRSHTENKMYFRLVRGNTSYGENNYVDNGDGTITDLATGLTWQQYDSGEAMDWESALEYAEDLDLAGYDDWRLPNAKELQSIVDYNRSLQTTNSAAIDNIFNTTSIIDPDGNKNYPYFWTGTTHLDGRNPYSSAVYIAFGEALGEMFGSLMDVHGAGAQRSDPKSGNVGSYPSSFGPQGDIRYVYNYVRCVRGN
jgi:ribonuclease BN (tRNA processing enzyme)